MKVRLLGTAAGGGFPQWNCACPNCRAVRQGAAGALPRRECCIAVSADERRWFLINAPPDVRIQLESFPPLAAAGLRGSGVEGVLLTGGDLDEALGLLTLREGPSLVVHATGAVRRSLEAGLGLESVLRSYAGVDWREPPDALAPLTDREGRPSGLGYGAFSLPGDPPRYIRGRAEPSPGDRIGYLIVDETTEGRLVVAPGIADLSAAALARLSGCDLLLLDGTFWDDDELPRLGCGTLRASQMGHVPVGGRGGSLVAIRPLDAGRKVYVHINNTNPILINGSPERRAVEAADVEVGLDGREFAL